MTTEQLPISDRTADSPQIGRVQIPQWAREYAQSFYSGSRANGFAGGQDGSQPGPTDLILPDRRSVQPGGQILAPRYYSDSQDWSGSAGSYASGYRSSDNRLLYQQDCCGACGGCGCQCTGRAGYGSGDYGEGGYWAGGAYGANNWGRRFQPYYSWHSNNYGRIPDRGNGYYYPGYNDRYPGGQAYPYGDGGYYQTNPRYRSQYPGYNGGSYYDNRDYGYPGQGGTYNDYGQYYGDSSNPYWGRMSSTIQSMVGHSIREYDPRVPETLGCARFVSAALNRAYGLPIYDSGCQSLASTLKRSGFVTVSFNQLQAGDVIIGDRGAGEHGHAAIYVGNGMIANNNSNKRRVSVDSINKFYSRDFQKVTVYRAPA